MSKKRPPLNLTKEEILDWINSGKTLTELANKLGFTKSHVCNYVRRMGVEVRNGRPKGIPWTDEQKKYYSSINSGSYNGFYGKKHSEETRKKMSENHPDFTGEKNPLKNAIKKDPSIRKKLSDARRGWFERLSKEEQEKIRTENSLREANSPKTAKMPNSKSGYYLSDKAGKIFYRSSWELKVAEILDKNPLVVWYDLEPFYIKYKDKDGVERGNRIDFFVFLKNGSFSFVDVKPKSMIKLDNNEIKIKNQEKYAKDHGWFYYLVCDIKNAEEQINNHFSTISGDNE